MALSPRASTPSGTPDSIYAAIAAHREAWQAWTAAPYMAFAFSDGGVIGAHRAALSNLLGTPCTTRAGAESLRHHLRACLAAHPQGIELQPFLHIVDARARDLSLFLDEDR